MVRRKPRQMDIKGNTELSKEIELIKGKRFADIERRKKIATALRKRKAAKGIPDCLWTNKGSVTPVVWKRIAGKMEIVGFK